MNPAPYRDMHLLDAVTHAPDQTQRELSKRIGVALGLTNLMLRRLAKKGFIKISGTKRSRIRYLITPKGILEKSRLTYEFVQYSLHLYGCVRHSLREQLAVLARAGHRRILMCGTGELAELAVLTIQEMGLELVGIADEAPDRKQFLGFAVRPIREALEGVYDFVLVVPRQWGDDVAGRMVACGLPAERFIVLSASSGTPVRSSEHTGTTATVSDPPIAVETVG